MKIKITVYTHNHYVSSVLYGFKIYCIKCHIQILRLFLRNLLTYLLTYSMVQSPS